MKTQWYAMLVFPILIFALTLTAESTDNFQYVSPKPGSMMVSPETNIIIREGRKIDLKSVHANSLTVLGSASGRHTGSLLLSEDERTLIFKPSAPFDLEEEVQVSVDSGVKTQEGSSLPPIRFTFTIAHKRPPAITQMNVDVDGNPLPSTPPYTTTHLAKSSDDPVPPDFPVVKVTTVNNPAPGYIFMTTSETVPELGYFLMMLNNDGTPKKYKRIEHHYSYDFKVQPNGLFSFSDISGMWGYAGGGRSTHRLLDTTFAVIDSFKAGNGYTADSHDFLLLPNGHAILHAYDPEYVDMSKLVAGGNPGAVVVGSIIQELDADKNVIFQWRSWDYIPILDTYMNTKAASFDYVHVNSYVLDSDGNLIASCRTSSEIIKINRSTGDIIWRLGGKKNQFTFIGERAEIAPEYISGPHCVSRIDNGNIILFDNGGFRKSPAYSRGLEYRLDENAKTATLVWEYRHSPDVYAPGRGSIQRLPNGNTLIGWGTASTLGTGKVAATEVRPDKSVAFECELPAGLTSYRAFRFPWPGDIAVPTVSVFDASPGVKYVFNNKDDATGVSIELTQALYGYNKLTVQRFSTAPQFPSFIDKAPVVNAARAIVSQFGFTSFKAEVGFDSTWFGGMFTPQNSAVYFREFKGKGLFIQLTTKIDPVIKGLIATTKKFGEFIVAKPDLESATNTVKLLAPPDSGSVNQTLPVDFNWAPIGFCNEFQLQVATDPQFVNAALDKKYLTDTNYQLDVVSTNATYYWRVRNENNAGTSAWSKTFMFTTTAPFIQVTSPKGGEKFQRGLKTTVKWKDNIVSDMIIELYKGGTRLSIIDTVVFDPMIITHPVSAAFQWTINARLPLGSDFKIGVRGFNDTTFAAFSDKAFSIIDTLTAVENRPPLVDRYALRQNFPNPFNPETKIAFDLPKTEFVTLKIYDMLGQEIETVISGTKQAGSHSCLWNSRTHPSGMYFYKLETPSFSQMRKMILMK